MICCVVSLASWWLFTFLVSFGNWYVLFFARWWYRPCFLTRLYIWGSFLLGVTLPPKKKILIVCQPFYWLISAERKQVIVTVRRIHSIYQIHLCKNYEYGKLRLKQFQSNCVSVYLLLQFTSTLKFHWWQDRWYLIRSFRRNRKYLLRKFIIIVLSITKVSI